MTPDDLTTLRELRAERAGALAGVDRKMAAEIERLRADGYPVTMLAEAAGFKTRQAVYDLLERAGTAAGRKAR